MLGEDYMAQSLARAGVTKIFGVVGIPVVGFATACQKAGIEFYSFRHEQSAAYAASAYGYLTGTPGVCLCVSGPGVVHSLPGLANAQVNCWPMLLLGGSHLSEENYKGAFQEGPPSHTQMVAPYVKFSGVPSSLEHFDVCLDRALSECMNGRPGGAYIELPENLLTFPLQSDHPSAKVSVDSLRIHAQQLALSSRVLKSQASQHAVAIAITKLKTARKPVIVVGKGCGYAKAEKEVQKFAEMHSIPFVATPMGKGVISDRHPLNASAARSAALSNADVVFLVGARLNWMLRYGKVFSRSAIIVQIDVSAEELGLLQTKMNAASSQPSDRDHIGLCGDIKLVLQQLIDGNAPQGESAERKQWKEHLQSIAAKSKAKVTAAISHRPEQCEAKPWMSYHQALGAVAAALYPPNSEDSYSALISEGANTMDMSRILLPSHRPRARLDAGTFAAMGPAFGYAIAAAVQDDASSKPVVAVVGDSSFGFSCMEIETACRYGLPMVIIIINNNGIYSGNHENLTKKDTSENKPLGLVLPVTALSPDAKYHEMAIALGAHSSSCAVMTPESVESAVREACTTATTNSTVVVLNVLIRPEGNTEKLANTTAFFNRGSASSSSSSLPSKL